MVRRTASLAQQVAQEIVSEIEAGTIASDAGLLPSEAKLSQRFEVSRATVREALSRLDLAGVVVRRQGVGTYVNSRRNGSASVRGWFDDATALMDFVRGSDSGARARVIECRIRPASEVARCLDIPRSEPVVAIEKLFFTGTDPVIHCVNIVPLSLVELDAGKDACGQFAAVESTYQFLDQCCHRRVHHQQSEIRAVQADESMARLLRCEAGAALLRVEEVGYGSDLQPVFYGLNHFRGDLVTFRQVRHPALSIGPFSEVPGCEDAA
jgi:DNA-binding GntR family transcriptional regulator